MMEWKTVLLIAHIVGVALGAGGATTSDFLFLSILQRRRIETAEYRLLQVASHVVVLGLLLLVGSGVGLVLINGEVTQRLLAKLGIVVVAVMNGFALHRWLLPLLDRCAHCRTSFLSPHFMKRLPLITTAGAISTVSWYAALILGMWRSLSLTAGSILVIYLAILAAAAVAAQVAGQILTKTRQGTRPAKRPYPPLRRQSHLPKTR